MKRYQRRKRLRRKPMPQVPVSKAAEPQQQETDAPDSILQLQSLIGNQATHRALNQHPGETLVNLQHITGNAARHRYLQRQKTAHPRPTISQTPARATIQRDVSGKIRSFQVELAKLASKAEPKMLAVLNGAGEAIEVAAAGAKDKAKEKAKSAKNWIKGKLKKKKEKKKKGPPKGAVAKLKYFTFGSDFTFDADLTADLSEMPMDMATVQMQLAQMGSEEQELMKVAEEARDTGKSEDERQQMLRQRLIEVRMTKANLQAQLQGLMQKYGEQQRLAIAHMGQLIADQIPLEVKQEAIQREIRLSDTPALFDLWQEMDGNRFRKVEITARIQAFAHIPGMFHPLRNTEEGQLLSDVKKAMVGESLDEMSAKNLKKMKKDQKRQMTTDSKLALGVRARQGENISDEEKEKANDPDLDLPYKTPKENKKITEDADKVKETFQDITKVTKYGGKFGAKPIVKEASGGTQDDEGLIKAIPTAPKLGADIADMAGSIALITEGNRAQKKKGQKELGDKIFKVFKSVSKVTKTTLKSIEQFSLSEADEAAGTTTALTDLGVPIVGIITSGASMVKNTVDAVLQGKLRKSYQNLNDEAQKDSQSKSLSGALIHGITRGGELMASSIAKGVTDGLALAGHIISMTGVGAVVGESIKMITRAVRYAQKAGEKLRDSYRTGKALASQYKAKVGVRGAENEVFENSPKYASFALLTRALNGDPVALKAVKKHGIDQKMIQDIRDGKVTHKQARDLILQDWKEKDDAKTIGMKIAEIKSKISDGLAKILDDKPQPEDPQELKIEHLGQQPFRGGMNIDPEEYQVELKEKKTLKQKFMGKLGAAKDKLKGLKDLPKKVKQVPGKVSDFMGEKINVGMRVPLAKWRFIKLVKNTVMYGGEGDRGGGWVMARILSEDSDVDQQFNTIKQILFRHELFEGMATTPEEEKELRQEQERLVAKLLEIMQMEMEYKQKNKIYDNKQKEDDGGTPWQY